MAQTFSSIRAMSLRTGDQLPRPGFCGGWDRDVAVSVVSIERGGVFTVLTLANGDVVRVVPMNQVPFIPRGR
jgi:hypothetical protein